MFKVHYLIVRLFTKLVGLFLAGFSLFYLVALLSFNSSDPSFNTVSTQDRVGNWMGVFGSHIADLSFQLIGLTSFILCLIIFNIGSKIMSKYGIRNLMPKLVLTPFCILCFSTLIVLLIASR